MSMRERVALPPESDNGHTRGNEIGDVSAALRYGRVSLTSRSEPRKAWRQRCTRTVVAVHGRLGPQPG